MLTLILGPMFSGKTSELIRLLVRADIAGKRVILIRPETDTREFLTHDGKQHQLEEVFNSDLDNMLLKITGYDSPGVGYDVVGIEEGQFFDAEGLETFVNYLANKGIKVLISALNGTSEREPFEAVQRLIPHAEEIIKLNAVCTKCGSEYGSYSYYRAGDKTDKVKVGDIHEYTALCRKCYNNSLEN